MANGPSPTATSRDRPAEKAPRHGATGSWDDSAPSNDEIAQWQQWLVHAGYYAGRPDGVWTDAVSNALKKWQVSVGLDATGDIDGETRAKLADIQEFLSPSKPAPAAPASGSKPVAGPPAPAGTAAAPSAAGGSLHTTPGTTDPSMATPELGGTPNPDGRFGIPGGGKVWKVGADWYVVYTVPGSNSPVPLTWKVENDDELKAIFGPGQAPKADRELSADEWRASGALIWGTSRQLANTSEHPFDAFTANFGTEAKVRPWLKDDEILALTVKAMLENRTVTDAELAGTKWWQSHTAAERSWISTFNSDPATAQQKITDSRDTVRHLMIAAGVDQPPEQLVTLIGDRMTAGTWSQQYTQNQIAKLGDPYAPGAIDPTLQAWVSDLGKQGVSLNTLADNTDKVEQLVRTWLGPAFAGSISKDQKQQWAGMLRNSPATEEDITNELRRKRLSLFPEYQDDRLSYEDIASTWRGVAANVWGQPLDENDPLFDQIVRLGGSQGTSDQPGGRAGVEQLLRTEGLKRGVGTVVNGAQQALAAGFGNGLRRVL